MFNVIRTKSAPLSLAANKSYKGQDVISALSSIFYGKCYLCEQDSIAAPEVEHFIPHKKTNALKFGWNNLFLVCRRCNGIKSNKHVGLLDCTNSKINVFEEIKHFAYGASVGEIIIKPKKRKPSQDVLNTVELLELCFNLENTALRRISKVSLMDKLLVELNNFTPCRLTLASRLSTPDKIDEAKATLKAMCQIDYPFSVFWKWQVIEDVQMNKYHPNLRGDLGF